MTKTTQGNDLVCWEAKDPDAPALKQARRLYEAVLDPAERIPWEWIAAAVGRRSPWRPADWRPHLLLAGRRPKSVAGFAYGIHVPDYGGYACYLGVDPRQRRQGVGSRLLQFLIEVLKGDAAAGGVPLPFVVWESRRPGAGAGPEEREMWRARLRLFQRVGAWWIAGLTFLAPNFARRGAAPVPLQLFLVPVDVPKEAWDAEGLRGVAAGLMEHVYGHGPGDTLFDRTLPPGARPVLRPVSELEVPSPNEGGAD